MKAIILTIITLLVATLLLSQAPGILAGHIYYDRLQNDS
jgi:hypothetical protein